MTKNKRIIVLLSVLILGIGVSLAFFVGKTLFQGDGAKTKVTTANINGATIEIYGRLNFNAKDMLPGHKDVSRIDVKATGDNILVSYNVIYKEITNTLKTKLKYTVYKVTELQDVTSSCNRKSQNVAGGQMVYEECKISNIDKLGSPVGEGTITSNQEILVQDEFINASPTGEKVSYYVIIEYPNESEDQSYDNNGVFSGEVTIGESDAEPDINILAINVEQENGKYKQQNEIPSKEDGYILNTEKSMCTNGATPIWDNGNHGVLVSNLTQSGTSCVLYFYKPTPEGMLAKLNETKGGEESFTTAKSGTGFDGTDPSGVMKVTGVDTENHENILYEAPDNDGTSYFFRGQANNNWVEFANKRWRIIRINGDGTLRLIYQCGNIGCKDTTNTNTQLTTKEYKSSPYTDNTYVGYYNFGKTSSTYDEAHQGTTPSTIASYLNDWYRDNLLATYDNYIDQDAGFCNDRQKVTGVNSSYDGTGFGTSATSYAAWGRVEKSNSKRQTQYPTLKCGVSATTATEQETSVDVNNAAYKRDLFTKAGASKGNKLLEHPIGLITADEVLLAGGFLGTGNSSYYLYTHQDYWVMSPYALLANGSAYVFDVNSDGNLSYNVVGTATLGVRPVINLRADITFSGGNGSVDTPFVVAT